MLVPQKLDRCSRLFQLRPYVSQLGLPLSTMLARLFKGSLKRLLRFARGVRFRGSNCRRLLSFDTRRALLVQGVPYFLEVLLQARHRLEAKQRLGQIRTSGLCGCPLGGRVV
ncbi:hypothetical protein SIO92_005375 [Burkholderia cenocepacia]|nr:hypothetical protein [Burkholderia cenocepacia]